MRVTVRLLRMWKALTLATMLCACGAKLADDSSNHNGVVDAAQNPLIDSAVVIDPDAGTTNPDAGTTAIKRVVYLNFTGVTLTKGPSDATTNTASWLYQATTGTAPPYAGGAQGISTITSGVTSRLTGIATVVTARPAAGPYVMVVYGGTKADTHSFFATAVNELDCGDLRKSDVAWIADGVDPTSAIDTTMGAIGFGLGLSSVNSSSDCMCSWADNCQRSGACSLRNAALRDQNVGTNPNTGTPQICPGNRQDEITVFMTAFQ